MLAALLADALLADALLTAALLADALLPASLPVSYTHLTLPTSDLV